MRPEAGDIVYGPFPVTTSDRRKINDYCLVLKVRKDGKLLLALGTSSHIDSCTLDHEVLISHPTELSDLKLRKPTRFDLKSSVWLDPIGFQPHSSILTNKRVVQRFARAALYSGLSFEEDE